MFLGVSSTGAAWWRFCFLKRWSQCAARASRGTIVALVRQGTPTGGSAGCRRGGAGGVHEATQQRDAADEGRLEAGGGIMVGHCRPAGIVSEREVVRPSQLIASVRRT